MCEKKAIKLFKSIIIKICKYKNEAKNFKEWPVFSQPQIFYDFLKIVGFLFFYEFSPIKDVIYFVIICTFIVPDETLKLSKNNDR